MTKTTKIINGEKLTIWEIAREGLHVASIMVWDRPFAKWSVHTSGGRVQFSAKVEAFNYCMML